MPQAVISAKTSPDVAQQGLATATRLRRPYLLAHTLRGSCLHRQEPRIKYHYGLISTFRDSRSFMARYPSGVSSSPKVLSNTRPGSIFPSNTSGSSCGI